MRPLLPIAALLLVAIGCGNPCENKVQRVLPSPDGARKALVYVRDCGLTIAPSAHVSVVEASWKEGPRGAGNALTGRGGAKELERVGVEWTGPLSLKIVHAEHLGALWCAKASSGVAVDCSFQ